LSFLPRFDRGFYIWLSRDGDLMRGADYHGGTETRRKIPVFWKTGGALSLQDTELGEQDIGAEQD
jgi:hypothetical protein